MTIAPGRVLPWIFRRRFEEPDPAMPPDRVPFWGAFVLAGAALASGSLAAPPILPFAEVKTGMRGSGRTVFAGSGVESFDVEVVGTLERVGPDQNLILVRLSGGPLAETGVLAGMSGSPVYVDQRLIGAVAYSWGFSKEAIAGVTPIEEMLRISEADGGRVQRRTNGAPQATDWRLPLSSAKGLAAFIDESYGQWSRAGGPQALPLPLSMAGMGSLGLQRLAPELLRAGFLPLQAGGTGAATQEPGPLRPGSVVGVKLVRGDLDMTAIGTLTWIEGDRLLAFGHPLFGLGSIDLPLTAGRVETLLPSFMQSSRIATPLGEIGAAREDRQAGIRATLGAHAQMIPVRVQLDGMGGQHQFSFEIADDPLLSPVLLYLSLNGVLASKERAFGSATVRLRAGSVIQLLDHDDVELDNVFAGPEACELGTGIAAYVLHLLMNGPFAPPRLAGINLLLEYEEGPRTAQLRRATLDRYRVAPGETVEVTVVLSPHRGPEQVVRRQLVVPAETSPGMITVAVGGALAMTRDLEDDEPALPRDLEQLIGLVNQLRRNDRIYIIARRDDLGVLLHGARMPNLPPSVAALLTRPKSKGQLVTVSERGIFEDVVATDYEVEGAVSIQLEVEAK